MTKLEQKLIQLGYKQDPYHSYIFYKDYSFCTSISIYCKNAIKGKVWSHLRYYDMQQDIDSLQQAFNELQKDLEILKAIDKPTPKSKNDIGNELWEKDVKHMQELGEWERKQWNY